jgi:hypothetical protein
MTRVVLAALMALALPASAAGYSYPGQRQAPPIVVDLLHRADVFWAERGVIGCPNGITAWQASDLSGGDGGAWARGWHEGDDCSIWVSDDLVSRTNFEQTNEGDLIDVCTAVTHEDGHARGLAHSETGVMSVNAPPVLHGWAPWFCQVWARTTIDAALWRDGQRSEWLKEALIRDAVDAASRLPSADAAARPAGP